MDSSTYHSQKATKIQTPRTSNKLYCGRLDYPICIYLINKLNKYMKHDSIELKQKLLNSIQNEFNKEEYIKINDKKSYLKDLLKQKIREQSDISRKTLKKIKKSNSMNALKSEIRTQIKDSLKPEFFKSSHGGFISRQNHKKRRSKNMRSKKRISKKKKNY